jgi:hypothetical protein
MELRDRLFAVIPSHSHIVQCVACGFPTILADSPLPMLPCVRRGPEVRRIACKTCQGITAIKVFACEIHAECTIGKQLEVVKCCAVCGDYEPTSVA